MRETNTGFRDLSCHFVARRPCGKTRSTKSHEAARKKHRLLRTAVSATLRLLLLFVILSSATWSFAARRERIIDSWKPLHYNVSLTFNDQLTEITSARCMRVASSSAHPMPRKPASRVSWFRRFAAAPDGGPEIHGRLVRGRPRPNFAAPRVTKCHGDQRARPQIDGKREARVRETKGVGSRQPPGAGRPFAHQHDRFSGGHRGLPPDDVQRVRRDRAISDL